MHKTRSLHALYLSALLVAVAGHVAASDAVPPEWLTPAEVSCFQATPSYDDTVAFLERLAARSPAIHLSSFGRSGAGRNLPLVIVSTDGAFTPQVAAATGKPILLLQSCIHPGEMDGKDASLMILRDWALGRKPVPKGSIVLFAPVYNPDGHEHVIAANRVAQEGPEHGVGFRATANRLDLNRDHMKLDSLEARALVSLLNRWQPHLHVDNHVTNGSDHQWVVTWSRAEAPQLAPSLSTWLDERMSAVVTATVEAGHPTGPYVGLIDRTDPTKGLDSVVSGARFSTGYFALRNRPSILVEMHALKAYHLRVPANRDFMLALIAEVERDPAALVKAAAEADARTVTQGRPDAEPSQLVLRWESDPGDDTVLFPAYDWHREESVVLGSPMLRFRRGELREIEVPWRHSLKPGLEVVRPRGYLVLPGWPQVEEMLAAHGLETRRLAEAVELEVETIRIATPELAAGTYQGRVLLQVETTRQPELRQVPAGALWVPAEQPLFELAAQLVEPEAEDSLVSWGFVSAVLERREYMSMEKLETWAREQLEDPELAATWQAALEDADFAADRSARYLWWYERSPWWDEGVGLLPVFRVMSVPESLE